MPIVVEPSGRLELITGSLEFVHVPVTASHDVSADPVHVALDPAGPWVAATWGTGPDAGSARFLAGADRAGGDLRLAPGGNVIYVRVTDSPEVPILNAGVVYVGR